MAKPLLRYFLFIFIFFIPVKAHAGVTPPLRYTFANLLAAGDVITTSTGGNTLCPGGSMTLMAGTATAPASTFVWYKDGQAISGATNSTIKITDKGRYEVYVTTAPATSPVQYPFIDITIAPVPVAGFTHSADGQCAQLPVQFTSTSTGDPLTYLWDFGDSNTSTDANPSHTFNTTAGCGTTTFPVKLTVTNSAGCTNTYTASVNVLRAPDLALQDEDQFYPFSNCHNNPGAANPNYTLKVNNVSPSAGCINSYTLDWGDGTIQTGLTSANFPATHIYKQLGAFNLTIIV